MHPLLWLLCPFSPLCSCRVTNHDVIKFARSFPLFTLPTSCFSCVFYLPFKYATSTSALSINWLEMVKVSEMGSAVAALPASAERLRQRYDNHLQLVAGCVPYKFKPNIEENGAQYNLEDRLEILMISSPNRDDLVFPKGGWENRETETEAACREAFEEAGVKGIIHGMLGVWEFRSKSSQNTCTLEGSCRGSMFAFEVTEELTSWPEQAIHQRRWLTVKEAFELCRYDWMREALHQCLAFLAWETASPVPEMTESPTSTDLGPLKRVESVINILC